MKISRYTGTTIGEALGRVKAALGPEAGLAIPLPPHQNRGPTNAKLGGKLIVRRALRSAQQNARTQGDLLRSAATANQVFQEIPIIVGDA